LIAQKVSFESNPPKKTQKIQLNVNGKTESVVVDARETLAEALRFKLKMTGTKLGCNRAECGTCTVIVDGKTVFSCSVLAVEASGSSIESIEGLAQGALLHPVQECFIEEDALQCGYCIPGMVMSCKNLLDHNLKPTEADVKQATAGNYCRCGAYPNIIRATIKAAEKIRSRL
jgi:carbon-monoxide dehydrogenase small subunit/xanthine dehydrogenase YagT iron-sulfur-binding subunit